MHGILNQAYSDARIVNLIDNSLDDCKHKGKSVSVGRYHLEPKDGIQVTATGEPTVTFATVELARKHLMDRMGLVSDDLLANDTTPGEEAGQVAAR